MSRFGALAERPFRLLFIGRTASLLGSAFAPVGGVWADRVPRNLVMVTTDLIMFAAQGTVALLLISGHAAIWQLAALQLVRCVAQRFPSTSCSPSRRP